MHRQRHEYALAVVDGAMPEVSAFAAGFVLRTVEPADLLPLAELMLEAFRDTIDHEGEGLAEAIEEVQRYLSPTSEDPALLGHSVLVCTGARLCCACLVMKWHRRQCPLIGYVMCHPAWKRRGLASLALAESLRRLREAGSSQIRAVITEGNVASERLFSSAGFGRLASR